MESEKDEEFLRIVSDPLRKLWKNNEEELKLNNKTILMEFKC